MRKIILCSRYLLFAVFIVCNAIICSVAIWNFSIGQSAGVNLHVDIFQTVLGALALVFVFPLGFIDIIGVDSVTSRVWFECLWIGVFASLEFAGAVAVSSISPGLMCAPAIKALLGNSCSSTQVLLAFSWICSICLICYFFLLIVTAAVYARKDPRIWHYKVCRFPNASPQSLRSAVPSPMYKNPTIVAPKPRRVVPAAMYAYRSGLDSQYDIEHFQPPTPQSKAPSRDPSSRRHTTRSVRHPEPTYPAMAFYPQHMQNILTNPPVARSIQIPELPPSPPPPPPPQHVVEWLRTLHDRRESTQLPAQAHTVGPSSRAPPPPRSKPTGPRSRSNSRDWRRLEPVDLNR